MRTIPVGPSVPRRGAWLALFWGWLLLFLFRWRVRGELPDVAKAVVILAPHTSNWDAVPAMGSIWGLRLRLSFMAKDSLFRWPFGSVMRAVGGIPVNRGDAADLVGQSVQKFRERDALWLAIAPEGTRNAPAAWKTGFYRIACEAGVPIVVASFDYHCRETVVLQTLYPSGDLDADMARILASYRGMQPRRPERLSLPLVDVNRH